MAVDMNAVVFSYIFNSQGVLFIICPDKTERQFFLRKELPFFN